MEAPIYGVQEVRTFTDVDSAEDIAQKIFSLTDIDVPHMRLYVRYEEHSYICLQSELNKIRSYKFEMIV